MKSALLAIAGLSALLLSCEDSRSTSTEVENELQLARLIGSGEDSAALAGAYWTLLDSTGDTLAHGITDAAGGLSSDFRWTPGLSTTVLNFASASGPIRSVLFLPEGFAPLDTLEGEANLLTESVTGLVDEALPRGISRTQFERIGDSVVRAVVGIPLDYREFASRAGHRPPEASAILGVLESQSRRSGGAPRAFVESLRLDPRRGVFLDTGFASDLADELRQLELSPDSQSLVAWRLDSLGGRGGKLVEDWSADRAREDSLLFATLLPWIADPSSALLRDELLDRADHLGHDATIPQPDPSTGDQLDRTVRRTTIRLWVMILGDLARAPLDSAERAALDQILIPTRMVMVDAWKHMRKEAWAGNDSGASTFIGSALRRHRLPSWSTQALVSGPDPKFYVQIQWPMPPQKSLNGVLDSLAATGQWGPAADIVFAPKTDSSTGP